MGVSGIQSNYAETPYGDIWNMEPDLNESGIFFFDFCVVGSHIKEDKKMNLQAQKL